MEMEEEKTSSAGTSTASASPSGCFFCAVLPMLERRWSEASQGHFRNARVEFLKGLRSMIDDRIARLSQEESKGTHVTVE
ncbi:MAG: hypothetical protein ABSC23_00550 [Bryobacteraceae bacterium]|jgi:hypothetical protein